VSEGKWQLRYSLILVKLSNLLQNLTLRLIFRGLSMNTDTWTEKGLKNLEWRFLISSK